MRFKKIDLELVSKEKLICFVLDIGIGIGIGNIAELVIALELTGKRIAIEQNNQIVAKSQYVQTVLQDGDVLEMVVAVGGG